MYHKIISRFGREPANMTRLPAKKSRSCSTAVKPKKSGKKKILFYGKFSKKPKKNKSAGMRPSRISNREVDGSSTNSKLSKKMKGRPKKTESNLQIRSASRKTDQKRRIKKSPSNLDLRNRRREERGKKGKPKRMPSNEKLRQIQEKSDPTDSSNSDSASIRKPPEIPQKTVMVVPQRQLERLKARIGMPGPSVMKEKVPEEEQNGPIGTICFPKASLRDRMTIIKYSVPKPEAEKQPEEKEEEKENLHTGEEFREQNYDASTKVKENKNFNGPIIVQDAQFKRMVPFWQLPATEEEKDEMFEERKDRVIDKELCQQMIQGAVQVVNPPDTKPTLDAEGDGELDDMEKHDQEYFDFDVVVGNTLKTVLFGFEEPEQGAKANGAKQHKPIPITFNEPKTAKFYDPSKKLTAMEPKEEKWTRTGIKLDPNRQNS